MTTQTLDTVSATRARFWQPQARGRGAAVIRALLVILGIAAGQAVLYGPSLIGARILLPLDALRGGHIYLPATSDTGMTRQYDAARLDLVVYYEPARQFAISELRAGRFPWWSPYEYGGVGCYRWNLSPPWLLGYLIPSPVVLAWIQLLVALIAGGGAYLFLRRVAQVGFWPAAIAAWCYPLTGAYIFWQGFWLPSVMCWLPWMLTATDATVRRPAGWGGPLLALVSGLAVLGGAQDVAGQVLLAAGIYAVGRAIQIFLVARVANRVGQISNRVGQVSNLPKKRQIGNLPHAAGAAALAWAIGILVGAWMLLPLAEYMQTGYRSVARGKGVEERPPVGLRELPRVILPDKYGYLGPNGYRIVPGCIQESSASAYAGMLATLVLAPLAWASRRHRSVCVLAAVLAFFGLGWALNVPLLVQILRLPGLNMLSHNRFVFLTAFALMVLAAVGMEVLWQGRIRRHWFLLPMALLGAILVWSLMRSEELPEPIATQLASSIESGKMMGGISDMDGVLAVQDSCRRSYAATALLAALGLAAWLWLWFRSAIPRWGFALLGALLVGDLLWFGYGRVAQDDPALYYPRLPVLEQLAAAEPGRMVGLHCLPANLAATHGLRDVRGYDGVDPARWVELLKPTADPTSTVFSYAMVEWLTPKSSLTRSGLTLPPILSMLNVRYLVTRGTPNPGFHPLLQGGDYIIWENPAALPRAFVPRRVETIADSKERIRRLSARDFDPAATAFVEEPLDLSGECRGTATITEDTPLRVTIAAEMSAPGLIVLSDRWDAAWNAYLAGRRVPIVRVNHAIRGVVTPAGHQVLQFRFEPATLYWGSVLTAGAVVAWFAWVAAIAWTRCGGSSADIDDFPPLEEVVTLSPEIVAKAASRAAASQQRGHARKGKGRR